jgi:putative ABC transport system permease protein
MSILRSLRLLSAGARSLLLHKLRSGLAVLGIMIGVSAVIWLVAMGEGVSYQAQQQIKDLGADNIILRSVKPPDKSDTQRGLFVRYGLLRDDFDRIIATVPALRGATPLRELHKEVRYLDNVANVRVVGCTPAYFPMNHLRLARGRFLADLDLAGRDNVCVLGDQAASKLFGHQEPLGRSIRIDRDFYVVVGVSRDRLPAEQVGGGLAAHDYNAEVCIPLDTLRARIGDQVAQAGMRRIAIGGDVITSIDGQAVTNQFDVNKILNRKRPGDVVPVVLYRGGKKMDVQVKLAERTTK